METKPMYGNFNLAGTVVGKNFPKIGCGYKEDTDKFGNKTRTLKFILKTYDNNFVPIRYYGNESKIYMYKKVEELNKKLVDGMKINVSGSVRYNNGIDFSLFKCNTDPKEENNNFTQQIVVNKVIYNDKTKLSVFMYSNTKGSYNSYDFLVDSENEKLMKFIDKVNFGDLIVASGKIIANPTEVEDESYNISLMITDFEYIGYRRAVFELSDFKDEVINSIFKGTHVNLQNLI